MVRKVRKIVSYMYLASHSKNEGRSEFIFLGAAENIITQSIINFKFLLATIGSLVSVFATPPLESLQRVR